ncbi:MAG: cell division FtsA domain-containing protein [Christensenellales bacterium]|jgi:cell division protein FtsA
MRSTITVAEFGTSKIVVLIAEVSNRQRCDIIGAGNASYDGYSEAHWNNPAKVNAALQSAIHKAEEQAKTSVRDIYCGVPGQFSKVYTVESKVELQGTDPHVTPRDVEALFDIADQQVKDLPGLPIHRSPAWFVVDDGKRTLEPLNLHGNELRSLISYVKADQFFIADVSERLRALGKVPFGFFSTPMGSAILYISDEERDRTAVLIDSGYLNTEVMFVQGDTIIYHKVIPIGGGHMSADLAYGLDISLDSAEQIKRSFVFGAQNNQTAFEITATNGTTQTFERSEVESKLMPRADELCEAIRDTIKESGIRLGNWSSIYLTGGGLAINKGGREYLSEKLGRPVRELPRKAVKLSSPIYASALGLLDLIIDTRSEAVASQSGIRAFFRNLFGG